MANTKQAKFIIEVSADSKGTRKSLVRFFSYDSKTAEIVIQAEKDNEIISKALISSVEIFFESVNSSYRPTDSLKWNDQMVINSDGLFTYTLPDELLNYQGLVAFEVYINYLNNDKSDSSNRIVYEQRTSAIDRAAGEVEIVYIKDMELAKKEVADKATEVKTIIESFDSGLDIYADEKKSEMDNFVDEVKQTADTEKGKIQTVFSTVEQVANEVDEYADKRIKSYDAKFIETDKNLETLNTNQSSLNTKLEETQQKITDADVFTKQESSANVINQIIGKTSVQTTILSDYKDKITGSKIENPNWAGAAFVPDQLQEPSMFKNEFTQARYTALEKLDGSPASVLSNGSGLRPAMCHKYDFIEIVKRELGDNFFVDLGANTIEQQIAVVDLIVTDFDVGAYAIGNGLIEGVKRNWAGSKLWIDNSQWTNEVVKNETNKTERLIIKKDSDSKVSRYLNNDGIMQLIVYGDMSDSVTTTSIYTDYVDMNIYFDLSANKYIKKVIAAYCGPLEEQLNDLVQKVAAIESK